MEAYAFLGMFINETIDNKVRKTICEEARKVCFLKKIMKLVKHMHFFFLQEIKLCWVFEDKNKDVHSICKLPKKPGKFKCEHHQHGKFASC